VGRRSEPIEERAPLLDDGFPTHRAGELQASRTVALPALGIGVEQLEPVDEVVFVRDGMLEVEVPDGEDPLDVDELAAALDQLDAGAAAREIHYEETNWKARPDISPDGSRLDRSSSRHRSPVH
jgi:hypothetical protein